MAGAGTSAGGGGGGRAFLEETGFVLAEDLDQEENTSDSGQYKNAPLREQDRFLPIANVAKIMKRAIPDNGKIAKDARECVQECLSEFISFITSEASDRCHVEKRKTVNGEDVLFAMNALGFDNYIEPLRIYLSKYREMVLSPGITSPAQPEPKTNKSVVLYEEPYKDDIQQGQVVTELEAENGEGTVIYTFPKATLGEFTLG